MKTLTLWMCLGVLLFSTSSSAAVLATINGKKITTKEFNEKYQENLKFYQFRAPSKKSVLDDMIKRELGIQEAKKMGLAKDPLVRDRMDTVLYQALLEKKLSKKFEGINIKDNQARAYYRKNPEIRTSHIFMAVPQGSSKKEEQKIRSRLLDVKKRHLNKRKMSFAEAAQRFSEGVAAPMGGDLDYQTRDRLDPNYYEAALRLKQGAVSAPVRSQFGWHLIRLTARRSWAQVDRSKIRQLAFEEQRKKIYEQYMRSLRRKAKVSVKYNLLK